MHTFLALAVASLFTLSAAVTLSAFQENRSVSLDETLSWLKTKIDDDRRDPTGVFLRTRLSYAGCNVTFVKTGGQLTLLKADVPLSAIHSLSLTEEPVGTMWTGTFLISHASPARSLIRVTEPDLSSQGVREGSTAGICNAP